MPKDNRKINRTVRVSGAKPTAIVSTVVKFGPGDEDELAAALTPAQGAAYLKSGALSGEWTFTGKPPKAETPAPPEKPAK